MASSSSFSPSSGVAARTGSSRRYWRHQQIAFAVCAVVAVLYTVFFCIRDAGHGTPIDVVEAASRAFADWLAWALLIPIAWGAAERWPLHGGMSYQLLGRHIGLGALVAVGQALLFWLFLRVRAAAGVAPVKLLVFVEGSDPRFLAIRFDSNLVIYTFVIAIVTVVRQAHEAEAANRLRIEAERRLFDARLEALRQQFRPHFLLNALNTFLNALTSRRAEAERVLAALSRLLARSESPAQLVSLGAELDLVRLYATIEEARFRDQLAVQWAIDPDVSETPIPPFALQTLFENAIRHAVPGADGILNIRVSAQRMEERVAVRVANDGLIGAADSAGTGIGLSNLAARLRLLFGERSTFRLYEAGGARTVAQLLLPLGEPV